MFTGETMEEIFSAVAEVTNTTGQRKAEIVTADEMGVKEIWGVPIVLDPSLPRGQIQIRHTDAVGRQHIVKVLDGGDELEAIEAAKRARRLGPQTPAEMLADFEFRQKLDSEMVAESRAKLKRGEITEDEVYTGDPLIQMGVYPLIYESKVRDQAIAAYIPVTTDIIEEAPHVIEKMSGEQARHIIQTEALKFLRKGK